MIVQVARRIKLGEYATISVFRPAVLLREGEVYSLWDPAAENELAKNMTPSFVQYLRNRGWILENTLPQ